MQDNDDEIEIKIEYFDRFEVDPLHTNGHQIQIQDIVLNLEIKPQETPLQIQYQEDEVISENNDPIEPEIVSWHKQINKFGKYVCRFCDLSYFTTQTLRHHVRTKHTENYLTIRNTPLINKRKYKVKCHICKKCFENTKDLQAHSNNHSLNEQNSCLQCLATFKEHDDLFIHMANYHKPLRKLHTCTTCGYSTPKISNLKKHMNIHTGKNKKKCAYCDYTTNSDSNLRIHEQTHSREKPYACLFEGCDYRSKTCSALRSHELMHDKTKIMFCDKCSYSTVYKINLKKHIDTHWRKKFSGNSGSNGLGGS